MKTCQHCEVRAKKPEKDSKFYKIKTEVFNEKEKKQK